MPDLNTDTFEVKIDWGEISKKAKLNPYHTIESVFGAYSVKPSVIKWSDINYSFATFSAPEYVSVGSSLGELMEGDILALPGIDPKDVYLGKVLTGRKEFYDGVASGWQVGAKSSGQPIAQFLPSFAVLLWRRADMAPKTAKLKMNPIFSKPLPLP